MSPPDGLRPQHLSILPMLLAGPDQLDWMLLIIKPAGIYNN